MIKNIIFDWGGVCTIGNLLKDFSSSLSDKIQRDKNEIEKSFRELEYLYETGKISPDEYWLGFKEKLNIKFSVKEIREVFLNSYCPNTAVLNYVAQLRSRYKTILLTNNYEDLFAHIKLVYQLDQ